MRAVSGAIGLVLWMDRRLAVVGCRWENRVWARVRELVRVLVLRLLGMESLRLSEFQLRVLGVESGLVREL